MKTGIMGAMPEEVDKIIASISNKKVTEHGSRLYYEGVLDGKNVVVAFSRWGKVASATTATHLILEHKVSSIIFTGVAGAVNDVLNMGDIVVGQRLFQHDMDARPLMRHYEIPLTGKTSFEIPENRTQLLEQAAHNFLKNNAEFRNKLKSFGITSPKMVPGDIASGDKFISDPESRDGIRRNLPSVLCVEMEGAAVAQVCHDYEIPLFIARIISDSADHDTPKDYTGFVNSLGGEYALGIIREFLKLI